MTDKKSDRLGTMVFTIANELVNHFGKKIDRPVIDDITRNLTLEMCSGPTAWAFSGKDEPRKPIFDEEAERQLFEDAMLVDSEEAGFGEPDLYRDADGLYRQPHHQSAWGGWIRCAQSHAKAGEETP